MASYLSVRGRQARRGRAALRGRSQTGGLFFSLFSLGTLLTWAVKAAIVAARVAAHVGPIAAQAAKAAGTVSRGLKAAKSITKVTKALKTGGRGASRGLRSAARQAKRLSRGKNLKRGIEHAEDAVDQALDIDELVSRANAQGNKVVGKKAERVEKAAIKKEEKMKKKKKESLSTAYLARKARARELWARKNPGHRAFHREEQPPGI